MTDLQQVHFDIGLHLQYCRRVLIYCEKNILFSISAKVVRGHFIDTVYNFLFPLSDFSEDRLLNERKTI